MYRPPRPVASVDEPVFVARDRRPRASEEPVDGPQDGRRGPDRAGRRSEDRTNRRVDPAHELRSFGELLALSGLAIAQPVLDVFGKAPEHLILRGVDRGDIVLFGLLVTFAVPLALWAVGLLVGVVSERARTALHAVMLWALASIVLALLLDGFLPRLAALGLAAALAAGFAVLHRRTRGPRIWLAFMTPAPFAFLALFLFASPVAPLLRGPAEAIGAEVSDPTRTVIVLFDELPLASLLDEDGLIDADLFPNFARLADTSDWYRQTTTIGNLTKLVVPAILTGHEPVGGTPSSVSYPENLFTLVGDQMPVTASEAITRMCPESLCESMHVDTGGLGALLGDARHMLAQHLDPSDPEIRPITDITEEQEPDVASVDDAMGEEEAIDLGDGIIMRRRAADGGLDRLDRFLDSIGEEPGLHFLHLMLPHHAYELLPDGTSYPRINPEIGWVFDGWVPEPRPVELSFQRYLLQLQRTDALLGEIMDDLEARGFLDETNLIVLSDHGFAYEPGSTFRAWAPERTGNDTSMAEILWVPFFVKAAGQTEGQISDDPVRNVDLTPTVADLLGVDIPWEHSGRSVFEGGSGDPDRVGMLIGERKGHPGVPGPYHGIGRELGWELLLGRTAGGIVPRGDGPDGVSGSDRIFRVGPRPDLWGEALPPGLERVEVDLAETSRADDVDPASGRVPALFQAVTEAEVGTDVAIAVNGTVWATTTVYPYLGERRIDAILPVRAFRQGSNDLSVHLVPHSSS